VANTMRRDLIMNIQGSTGKNGLEILQNISASYRFMSIVNPTNNTLYIFQSVESLSSIDVNLSVIRVNPNNQQTFPLDNRTNFTIYWEDGGGTEGKKAVAYLSYENLNMNGTLADPTSASSVDITADSVGLARQKQLPTDLTPSGRLAVELPGNQGVRLTEPLPAGDKLIGKVQIDGGSVGVSGDVSLSGPLPAGDKTIGKVDVNGTVTVAGDVGINKPLPSGENTIGKVDVNGPVTVTGDVGINKPLPTGNNVIGKVELSNVGTLDVKGNVKTDLITMFKTTRVIATMTAVGYTLSGGQGTSFIITTPSINAGFVTIKGAETDQGGLELPAGMVFQLSVYGTIQIYFQASLGTQYVDIIQLGGL